jgi:hypothetical protein
MERFDAGSPFIEPHALVGCFWAFIDVQGSFRSWEIGNDCDKSFIAAPANQALPMVTFIPI